MVLKRFLIIISLVIIVIVEQCNSARILCVYGFPSLSHQIVFREVSTALANRGHELVVITTDLSNPEGKPHENITEIDVKEVYNVFIKRFWNKDLSIRGIKYTTEFMLNSPNYVHSDIYDVTFNNPKVKALYENENEKFDLVFVDALLTSPLWFAKRFQSPLIWFSTLHGLGENYEAIGAPSRHPFLYPNIFGEYYNDRSFIEKIKDLIFQFRCINYFNRAMAIEDEYLKNRFGDNAPTVKELKDGIDLVFVNTDAVFEGNRPVPPGVIHLGRGIHLKPVKPLPEELKKYLDSSTRGVIYVSFGSNVRPSQMDPDLLEDFLIAFEELPYDVLWKFDTDDLPRRPKNIRFEKWFPQRDLLMHPNIKVFITQAGLQSTSEAIDAHVPLIGIPMIAEQPFNSDRYVKLGIGARLDVQDITVASLKNVINAVIGNDSYKENLKKLRAQIIDQPETAIERAVWWTEYVLRHKGAKHLRSPQANITWTEYLQLEIVAFIVFIFVMIITIVIFLIRFIIRMFFGKSVKIKQS